MFETWTLFLLTAFVIMTVCSWTEIAIDDLISRWRDHKDWNRPLNRLLDTYAEEWK